MKIRNFAYRLYTKLDIDGSSRLDEGSKIRNSETIVKSNFAIQKVSLPQLLQQGPGALFVGGGVHHAFEVLEDDGGAAEEAIVGI